MAKSSAQNSFFSWLGRQIGHVKEAVKMDAPKPQAQVIYRNDQVEEKDLPNQPGVKLRRTTIDEVIVDRQLPGGVKNEETTQPQPGSNSAGSATR